VEFFELPKTISGKIRRVELRGRESELAAGSTRFGSGAREWRDEDFPALRGG
jgi:acetyl-CoA synthetase